MAISCVAGEDKSPIVFTSAPILGKILSCKIATASLASGVWGAQKDVSGAFAASSRWAISMGLETITSLAGVLSKSSSSSIMFSLRSRLPSRLASSIIAWNLSCATMVSLSTVSSCVICPYGKRKPRPIVCSVRVSEAEALKGTIVYRLVTSHPSLSIFTWITISVLFSGFSTESNLVIFSSFSLPFWAECTTITLSL